MDLIQRRKNRSTIDDARERDEEKQRRYRPPCTRATGTDIERRRLQNTFQFKGGKALPDHMMPVPIKGHLPLSMMTGRVREVKKAAPVAPPSAPTALQEAQKEFDYLAKEVDDRTNFLEEMVKAGKGEKFTNRVTGQIKGLVRDMGKYDTIIQREELRASSGGGGGGGGGGGASGGGGDGGRGGSREGQGVRFK